MPSYDQLQFTEVEVPPALAVQVPGQCAMDPASIAAAIGSGFATLMPFLSSRTLTPNAPPRVVYTGYGAAGMSFTVAMPVASAPEAPPVGSITVGTLPGAKAFRFTHHGAYKNLAQTYNDITAFLTVRGWMHSEADWAKYMPMWEEYLNDPDKTPEADLLTYIYLPRPDEPAPADR